MELNEQDVAALREASANVKEMAQRLPAIEAEVAAVKEAVGEIDVQELSKRVETATAQYDKVVERIRNWKGGLYVPGLEEEGEKFSLHRAAVAVATRDWKHAGFEKEVFDNVREKGQRMGVDSEGGFFVPDQVIPDVIGAIYRRSVFIGLDAEGTTRVSVLDGLIGNPVKVPAFEGGMIAYWMGEQDKYVESQVGVGSISLVPKKLTVLAKLTEEMRKFSSFGFETLMRNDAIRALAAELDRTIPYGKGNENEPRGLMKMPIFDATSEPRGVQFFSAEDGAVVTSAPADAQGGELDFDGLQEMMGALEDQNVTPNESWATISAPRYFRRMKQLKVLNFSSQTEGRPYLVGVPMLTDTRLAELIGPFDKSTMVPTAQKPGASAAWPTTSTTEKFGDVFAGNWSEVVLGRWAGIEITDDAGRGVGFPTDEIFIKFRLWADIQKRQGRTIVVCPDAQMRD